MSTMAEAGGLSTMTNAVVYSAIYGDYESTAKPLPADLPCPAVMFTDNPKIADQAPAAGWQVIVEDAVYHTFDANPANGDPAIVTPMLAHKWWKTHPNYAVSVATDRGVLDASDPVDVTIWLDGSMEISVSGVDFVDRCLAALGDDDWSLMAHPWRKCVFDEAVYSSTLIHRYDAAAMMRQHDAYLEAGHPRGWGLFATGHMVRRARVPAVLGVGEDWWQHNVKWSHQDQLSLPLLVRMYGDKLKWNTNLPWGSLWRLHAHGL